MRAVEFLKENTGLEDNQVRLILTEFRTNLAEFSLRMPDLLSKRDLKNIRLLAHSQKSVFQLLGENTLYELLQQINKSNDEDHLMVTELYRKFKLEMEPFEKDLKKWLDSNKGR